MRKYTYFEAYLDDFDKIVVYFSKESYGGISNRFYLRDEAENLRELMIRSIEQSGNYNKYLLEAPADLCIGKEYEVVHQFARATTLTYAYITKQERFDELFAYDGDDLGFRYTKQSTAFALWAPTAARVKLELFFDQRVETYEMKRSERGVFRFMFQGDLDQVSYVYHVRVNGAWRECIDPYGIAATLNSRRSVVVDSANIPSVPLIQTPMNSVCDAIIYETSIRDFTAQEGIGVHHPATFAGFIEENEQTKQTNSGFTYLKELGVTHVQLMPVMDFGSVDEANPEVFYNWGYDPLQWCCPEGSFASERHNPYSRMKELAQLVAHCHHHGLRVNLDMVFNHVYDINTHALQRSVPYYFFQMNEMGHLSNGSFCGNDVDTKRRMCRHLLLHVTDFLCKTYGIDGFRLDLMGILDLETVNLIYACGRAHNPDFMLYGEGWDMPSFLANDQRASIPNNDKMPNVAHFSDRFRDVVKGKTSDYEVGIKGYCSGDVNLIDVMKNVMLGSCHALGADALFVHPRNVVNYVECHDNMTCWDKLKECCKEDMREARIRRQLLCIGAVLLAQGIPFLHSGQEFARTKHGKGNTYNDSDEINRLDYQRKNRYQELVEHTRALIKLRKDHFGLRYNDREEVSAHVRVSDMERKVLVYEIDNEQEHLIAFFNPTYEHFTYHLATDYVCLYDDTNMNYAISKEAMIPPLSLIVFAHERP